MLQRTTAINPPPVPGRPLRVLIEDPALIADELANADRRHRGDRMQWAP